MTGLPVGSLGSTAPVQARDADDGHGGHDLADGPTGVPVARGSLTLQTAPRGNYSGVWLSRYEFVSSNRDNAVLLGLHHVVLLQHGSRLTVRSLPNASLNANSPLTMDLQIDGATVTGTWTEQTDPNGYHGGARYFGAIQMLAGPTGRHMAGKWVGFGKEFDVNTGPWGLRLLDADTGKAALAKCDRLPEA